MLRTGESGRQSNAAALTSGLHIELGCRWSTAPWTAAVQTVLQDALALRKRCNAGGIGEHGVGLRPACGRLEARFGRLIVAPAVAGLAAAPRAPPPARTGLYRIDTLVEGLMP